MGKLLGNSVILVAGSIVLLAELLAVGVVFLSAIFIVMGRRLTQTRAA